MQKSRHFLKRSTWSVMHRKGGKKRRSHKRWQRGDLHVKENWASSPLACRIIAKLRNHGSADFMPTRLVVVSSWEVVKLQAPAKYIALSYVWTQHLDKERLRRTVTKAMQHTGIGYVWIDAMCVEQDDPDDLAREIPRMGPYYERATGVLAIVPELATAMMQLVDPLGDRQEEWIKKSDGDELLLDCWLETRYRELGRQLRTSRWSQRVWTFQEAVLNKNTLAWNGWGFCAMEDLAVARVVEAFAGKARVIVRLMKKLWLVGEERGGSLTEATSWNPFLRETLSPKIELANLPALWGQNRERQCAREEDLVYGYMGLARDLPENITLAYGSGFETAYERLMRGRAVNLTVLRSLPSTVPGKCWMPKVEDNRLRMHPHGIPVIWSTGLIDDGGLLQVNGFMAKLLSGGVLLDLKPVREPGESGQDQKVEDEDEGHVFGIVSGGYTLTQEQWDRHVNGEVLCVELNASGVEVTLGLVGRSSGNRFHREATVLLSLVTPPNLPRCIWKVGY